MWVFNCIFVCLYILHNCGASTSGSLLYEDLGCTPIKHKPSDENPSSYNCDERLTEKCTYKGQKYEVDDPLPANISITGCSIGCICNQQGTFTCAELRCPEIGGVTLRAPECYHIYSLKSCCNIGQECPPYKKTHTCEVDGKTYKEGQRFYPKDSCSICICKRGFSGKIEAPYCRKLECGSKFKYLDNFAQKLSPFYDDPNFKCCPSSWYTLEEDDVIVEAKMPSDKPYTCMMGNKTLKIGDGFEKTQNWFYAERIIKCECEIPPLVTCVLLKQTPK